MNVSRPMALRMFLRGLQNTIRRRPLSVSFEITHACTANCWHCNWGGPIKETRLSADEYAAICRGLKPVVSHISGGEPLARNDVDEIIRAQANPGRLPFMVVVTNASQLSGDRFLRLKRAGMHQLSISIDFPDDRHSEFRRIPGLFDRMDRVVPECVRLAEPGGVVMNCSITSWNYRDVPAIVDVAQRWGTSVNFSAYTPLRTSDDSGLVTDPDEQRDLRRMFEKLIAMKQAGKPVYTSERVLWRYYDFLCGQEVSNCRAGDKFLVISPDGRLVPCAMVMAYFTDHRSMQREFTCTNTCTRCYISTRANTEKTVREFLVDNLAILSRAGRRRLPVLAETEETPVSEPTAAPAAPLRDGTFD
jgi:MoaA/NifB/PqqE/SkfB family radical SAM enzyme